MRIDPEEFRHVKGGGWGACRQITVYLRASEKVELNYGHTRVSNHGHCLEFGQHARDHFVDELELSRGM